MEERQVVEINGLKLDLDMRTAKRIDTLRVGDRVKVLQKSGYGDGQYDAKPGTIVGFEPFPSLPTIIVAVIEANYNGAEIKFVHINAKSKDVEIVKAIDDDQLDVRRDDLVAKFNRTIEQKRLEIEEIERRRDFFLREFRAYWEPVTTSA